MALRRSGSESVHTTPSPLFFLNILILSNIDFDNLYDCAFFPYFGIDFLTVCFCSVSESVELLFCTSTFLTGDTVFSHILGLNSGIASSSLNIPGINAVAITASSYEQIGGCFAYTSPPCTCFNNSTGGIFIPAMAFSCS